MGFQEVGLTSFHSDLTSLLISDIDTFILIKRDLLSSINNSDFNRRNVFAWTQNQPLFTSLSGLLAHSISDILNSLQQKSFIFSQNFNVLDFAIFKGLTRLQEEGNFSLPQLSGSPLVGSGLGVEGVQDNTILSVVEGSSLNFTNNFFMDILDVELSDLGIDDPLFTSLSFDAIDILEGLQSSELQGLSISDNCTFNVFNDFFVNLGKI
mmetsp:Transcript_29107/g.26501  ORF Transcript_29107/g.26501 Transcript_29107/m.26501 type:complete len:209 (-) Transcript_29107:667-1293(-)